MITMMMDEWWPIISRILMKSITRAFWKCSHKIDSFWFACGKKKSIFISCRVYLGITVAHLQGVFSWTPSWNLFPGSGSGGEAMFFLASLSHCGRSVWELWDCGQPLMCLLLPDYGFLLFKLKFVLAFAVKQILSASSWLLCGLCASNEQWLREKDPGRYLFVWKVLTNLYQLAQDFKKWFWHRVLVMWKQWLTILEKELAQT